MEFSLSGMVLTKDLYAADGRLIASRSEVVDLDSLKEMAARAPKGVRERFRRDHLTGAEALALEDHPLVGALLLASTLGDAPAVHFALLHHTRAGFGYPRLQGRPPLRGLDLISVASAFAALVSPRSYRQQPYNPRGAVDQLTDEAT